MSNPTNYALNDLTTTIQLAREQAMLGVYDESLKRYTIALQIIQQRIKQVPDDFLKEKWKNTENFIKIEIKGVADILQIGKSFKVNIISNFKTFDADRKVKEDNYNNNKAKGGEVIIVESNQQKKMPNISHFGGRKPFEANQFKDDPFDDVGKSDDFKEGNDMIRNFENNKQIKKGQSNKGAGLGFDDGIDQNYVIERRGKANIEKKDPMVWDPPEKKPNQWNFDKKSNF